VGAVVAAGLAGCAGVTQWEPLKVSVVSIETAPSQGFELRFNIKLRVQNPNDFSLEYNGLAVELEINGKATATGVSADKGTLPRFGEAIIELPVSVSALAALKQIVKMAEGKVGEDGLPYVLTGKVNTPWLGAVRFSHTGVLTLPH
jgi:LEA14-like dessication related protein